MKIKTEPATLSRLKAWLRTNNFQPVEQGDGWAFIKKVSNTKWQTAVIKLRGKATWFAEVRTHERTGENDGQKKN